MELIFPPILRSWSGVSFPLSFLLCEDVHFLSVTSFLPFVMLLTRLTFPNSHDLVSASLFFGLFGRTQVILKVPFFSVAALS